MRKCDFCLRENVERPARWDGFELAKGSRGLMVVYWAEACDEHKGKLAQDATINEIQASA